MDKDKLLKMAVILAAIVVIASGLSKFLQRDSISLSEYARLHSQEGTEEAEVSPETTENPTGQSPEPTRNPAGQSPHPEASPDPDESSFSPITPDSSPVPEEALPPSLLTGASLNGNSQSEKRVLLEDGFYYEPLSDPLRRYITGISFPGTESPEPEITFDELRYVHILHYDFEGSPREGELICNEFIAQDLVEIFYELYRSEYQLEKVLLIEEYDGNDNASMEDNNTSCFNYRPVEGSTRLSKHAYGLAVDINPLYNPYITYETDGSQKVQPASAASYSDRSLNFPYKIDEEDLCFKLFLEHGFTWGGHWNNVKDYQHFQKTK